jgi:hypothetical protein
VASVSFGSSSTTTLAEAALAETAMKNAHATVLIFTRKSPVLLWLNVPPAPDGSRRTDD